MKFDKKNMRDVFGETLLELGREHPELVVLDADLNTSTRTVLFKDAFPDRFIQCGIAECNMFGIAAGLAREGFVPFPVTFASFAAHKALDQIYMNVILPRLNIKIPGCYAGMTAAECGPSHNCAEDLAIMRAMPYIRVVSPGDAHELREAMKAMMRYDGPVYFRVPRIECVTLCNNNTSFAWNSGCVLQEGHDCALLGTGMMTGILLQAAEQLAAQGIHAAVAHFACIKPLDTALVARLAQQFPLLVTLENGRTSGGFGSAVSETVCDNGIGCKVVRMGLEDSVFHSDMIGELLRFYHLTPSDIERRVMECLQ